MDLSLSCHKISSSPASGCTRLIWAAACFPCARPANCWIQQRLGQSHGFEDPNWQLQSLAHTIAATNGAA
jgi:hypothetical protein